MIQYSNKQVHSITKTCEKRTNCQLREQNQNCDVSNTYSLCYYCCDTSRCNKDIVLLEFPAKKGRRKRSSNQNPLRSFNDYTWWFTKHYKGRSTFKYSRKLSNQKPIESIDRTSEDFSRKHGNAVRQTIVGDGRDLLSYLGVHDNFESFHRAKREVSETASLALWNGTVSKCIGKAIVLFHNNKSVRNEYTFISKVKLQ